MNVDLITIFNTLLILVPPAFALYLLRVERRDNNCDVLDDASTCNNNGGMSWAFSTPQPEDSPRVLLEKIKRASNAETHSIKWRRSLILAVVLCYIVLFLGFLYAEEGSIPDWRDVYVLVTLFFVVLYFTLDYYSYHIFSKPRKNIREAVDRLSSLQP